VKDVTGKEREGLDGERIGKGDGMEGSSWIFVEGAPPPEMLVMPMANAVV